MFTGAGVSEYAKSLQQQTSENISRSRNPWTRASSISPDNHSYFIPDTHLYRETFKRDRRSAKELENFHRTGTWSQQGLACFELAKTCTDEIEQGRLLQLSIDNCIAAEEILATRTYHYELVLSRGVKPANQLAELVDNKALADQKAVPSKAYEGVLSEFSGRVVVETAKQVAKDSATK